MIIKNITDSYKQTDWGIIPKDWDYEILQGKIVIVHGFGFQSQYFNSQGLYRLTTPGHFYEEGGFRDVGEKQKYYDGPLPDGYLLRSKDLIVAMTEQADGLLGSAAIIPESGNYLHNQRLGKVKPISSDIEIDFLYYIFNSKKFRLKVRETAAGTKVKHTSPNKLLEIAVPIPPPPEQKAIAQSLSDVDALIAKCDRIITKKHNTKQSTMQELLTGKKRLPGFSGEWEVEELGKIALLERGKFSARPRNDPKFFGGDIPFIQTGDVTKSNGVITTYNQSLNHEGLRVSKLFPSNTLFFTIAANIGDIGIASFETACPDSLIAITPQAKIDKKWLFHALKSRKKSFESLATQNAQLNINLEKLKPYLLKVPAISEQQAIAQILSDMDTEIATLEQKRDKYKAIKQGMMQELLTGKTRLKYDLDN